MALGWNIPFHPDDQKAGGVGTLAKRRYKRMVFTRFECRFASRADKFTPVVVDSRCVAPY